MGAEGQQAQPSLLVWGHVNDGQIRLEPAFYVNTHPRLPRRPRPYSLEARASDGSTLFGLSFSPDQIADVPGHQQSFVFAVPMSAAEAVRVSTLRLRGQGREAVLAPAAPRASPSVQLRRITNDRVSLRWDSRFHPLVMVRDSDTGEVLSLARGGDVQLISSKNRLDLVLSDGVKSHLQQLSLP